MFILATTELHKIPATILSRCQRFAFKRILPQDIQGRLSQVAVAEGIDLRPDGAELLSRLADGALRDALALLDQCAATGGTVDSRQVLDTLGLAGSLQTAQLMEQILRRDAGAALTQLHQLYNGGKEIGAILNELSTLSRDLLISMTAPKGPALRQLRRQHPERPVPPGRPGPLDLYDQAAPGDGLRLRAEPEPADRCGAVPPAAV